ncbi:MAG: 4-hydroxythreonine-4-phosphate dehydrogenase PdxA [Acidobacteriota bacterium]
MTVPTLALTQGDPAGIGPEILLTLVAQPAPPRAWRPLLLAERAALAAYPGILEPDRLCYFDQPPSARELDGLAEEVVAVVDPVGEKRAVVPGSPQSADAAGALAALDLGARLAEEGIVDALVTAPLSKETIDRWVLPGFVGHTDYLAQKSGLQRYGQDYLMAFLAPDLQVALLSTHLSLRRAIEGITGDALEEALTCLHRHAGGRIAVAGLNPHAGEGGLLGEEDDDILQPAVAAARRRGIDANGPFSADSLFARARSGEFDWVLALYHDQGLIAVKTLAFGLATNWTLGLPYLRTSVDHGTAFDLAGTGQADAHPLIRVVETTLELIAGKLPRRSRQGFEDS